MAGMPIHMVPEGDPGQKNGPYKCPTFPKSSRRADSEYVKLKLFRWGPSEKSAFLCFFGGFSLSPSFFCNVRCFFGHFLGWGGNWG